MGRVLAALGVAFGLGFGGAMAATAWLAFVFAHQPALGAPWLEIGAVRLYPPWRLAGWRAEWGALYPRPFAAAAQLQWAALLAALLAFVAIAKSRTQAMPFGLKAWASFDDAKAAGLFAASGAVLGKLDGQLLCFDGAGHLLLVGPSRSGKGRGQVVPTLLAWPEAALVLDVKGELADGDARFGFVGAAGFRQTLGPVLRFAPTRQASVRFNPLFEVRKGANEVRDVQNLVEVLIDPAGEQRRQDFWDKSAKNILVGVILHVLYAEPDERKTLAVVRETLRDLEAAAQIMKSTLHRRNPQTGAPETHPEVLHAAESFLAAEERVQSGVKATAESFFGLFADEIVAANTARSDFRVGDLMCGPRPVTLFLQPPPSDVQRLMPLMRLIVNLIARSLMEDQNRDAQGRPKRHRLLLLLDEFPLLGRMPFFETMMGAMAGYGMKAFLVCQSLNHLNKAYGRDNVILDNCQLVSVFGAVDPETAKRIAEMAGELWEERESSTEHSPKPILGPSRRSQTRREERRPLLVPGQVRALSPREALIFVAGAKPLRAQRLHFDREKRLRERLLPARAGSAPLTTSHDWSGVRAIAPAKASARARRRALLSARTDAQASLFNHQARQERLEAANRAAASLNQPEALPAHVRSKGI